MTLIDVQRYIDALHLEGLRIDARIAVDHVSAELQRQFHVGERKLSQTYRSR